MSRSYLENAAQEFFNFLECRFDIEQLKNGIEVKII